MRIDETKVFLFTFKTDQGDVQFPMRAETSEEAKGKMQQTLLRMQAELAMDAPKVTDKMGTLRAHEEISTENPPITIATANIPPEVLEMRMDTLLGDLGAGGLKGKAKADTVKLWTGHDLNEANYIQIIGELELIRTGQKEVPIKKKNG